MTVKVSRGVVKMRRNFGLVLLTPQPEPPAPPHPRVVRDRSRHEAVRQMQISRGRAHLAAPPWEQIEQPLKEDEHDAW
jgi:hypothetical protein